MFRCFDINLSCVYAFTIYCKYILCASTYEEFHCLSLKLSLQGLKLGGLLWNGKEIASVRNGHSEKSADTAEKVFVCGEFSKATQHIGRIKMFE